MTVYVLNIFSLDPSSFKITNVDPIVCESLEKAELERKKHSWQIYCDNEGEIDFDVFGYVEYESYYYDIVECKIK